MWKALLPFSFYRLDPKWQPLEERSEQKCKSKNQQSDLRWTADKNVPRFVLSTGSEMNTRKDRAQSVVLFYLFLPQTRSPFFSKKGFPCLFEYGAWWPSHSCVWHVQCCFARLTRISPRHQTRLIWSSLTAMLLLRFSSSHHSNQIDLHRSMAIIVLVLIVNM